eukprot:6495860-Prymnesium_polylepis.3
MRLVSAAISCCPAWLVTATHINALRHETKGRERHEIVVFVAHLSHQVEGGGIVVQTAGCRDVEHRHPR